MARALSEIYAEIQELSDSEKQELLSALIAGLDAPADPDVAKAWLTEARGRHRDLVDGTAKAIPVPRVFEHLRSRLRR